MAKSTPPEDQIFAALAATWPPAATEKRNGWLVRTGAGGGKRVSAASAVGTGADISLAERMMDALGQPRLFALRAQDSALDARLADAGYTVVDPTLILAAPLGRVTTPDGAPGQCITADLRLSVMEEIWANGGIGPARLAVMDRVQTPRTYILIRNGDAPAATAFAAASGEIAMLHALEVDPAHRRNRLGALATATAARWAAEQGATTLALAVTRANTAARALYESMGLREVSHYHYRMHEKKVPG